MAAEEESGGSERHNLFGSPSAPDGVRLGTSPLILILGPPGSGKGTQAARLGERLILPHISTGDMLRERILRADDFGREIAARIDVGHFVPDEWINRLLDERLQFADCRNGFILDGYPRTFGQAERLVQRTTRQRCPMYVVRLLAEAGDLARRFAGRRQCDQCGALFHIEFQPSLAGAFCDRPDCEGRLLPRADDREEFLAGRLQDYEQITKPVIDFLAPHCERLAVVRASGGSPGEIHERLWQKLMEQTAEQ